MYIKLYYNMQDFTNTKLPWENDFCLKFESHETHGLLKSILPLHYNNLCKRIIWTIISQQLSKLINPTGRKNIIFRT